MTLTAKRQATLPAVLCRDLGVRAGDKIRIDRALVEGEPVWVLRVAKPDWSWYGAARGYARGRSHRWSEIERSLGRAWGRRGRSDRT